MRGRGRRSSVVVGRQTEIDRLRRGVRAARDGSSACLVLAGEAGVGKTRLLNEALDEAKRVGVTVLVGRSSVVLPSAFGVVAEAIRSWSRTQRGPLPSRGPFDAGLSLIVPEWPVPATGTMSDNQLRLLALEGVVDLLRDIAADGGALMLLDDLHGADAESLDCVRYIAGAAVPGLLLVVTLRSDPSLAADLVRALEGQGLAEVWGLEPLPAIRVEELLTALLDTRPPQELIDDVITRTDGVPLLVEEVVDAHLRAGSLTVDD